MADKELMRRRADVYEETWPTKRPRVIEESDRATQTINLMNADPGKFLVDTGAQVPLIGKPQLDTLMEYRRARGLPLPIWVHQQKA